MQLLPSPEEVKTQVPLSESEKAFVERSRSAAKKLALGTDQRLALFVGPCSLHNISSAIEYAKKLRELSDRVEESCFVLMRAYFEKPRTSVGWKGLLYDPHLSGSCDLEKGIILTRKLLRELLRLRLPLSAELLEPNVYPYFDDMITWGFIGSRTSASQIHRQIASALPFPVGIKNCTEGSVDTAINGVLSARSPHTFFGIDSFGRLCSNQSQGNPYAHIVLRGSHDKPNYAPDDVQMALNKLSGHGVMGRLIIDCSHGNSGKDADNQPAVFASALKQARAGNNAIMGLMIESFLKGGRQDVSDSICPRTSITDGCIDWETTAELIESATLLPV